ncbi:MAG: cysteine hydrolase [Solobacterium sp.]|nr:cysteine hydrolase [Solobacterium sp.]
MKILAVIDMQNDFIDMALGTKEAVQITDRVVKEILDPSYDRVIATMDTHEPDYMDTLEGKKLPVEHCIRDTEGWQFNAKIASALAQRDAEIVEKPTFGSLKLQEILKEAAPDEIVFCGLCTDICVISNTLLARAALKDTPMSVLAGACAGTTPEKHTEALSVMASCQIDVKE